MRRANEDGRTPWTQPVRATLASNRGFAGNWWDALRLTGLPIVWPTLVASHPGRASHCADCLGIEAQHGSVDILVNNAALATHLSPKPFEQISMEEWTRVLMVNTGAPFLCSKAVAPRMRERRWGRIINLTSATIFTGIPPMLHYVASKGAIATMTRSLARELGRDGITVNAIAPGLTMTKGIQNNSAYSEELIAQALAAQSIPIREQPEDLVGACLYLASESARMISGQILTVDGGTAFH